MIRFAMILVIFLIVIVPDVSVGQSRVTDSNGLVFLASFDSAVKADLPAMARTEAYGNPSIVSDGASRKAVRLGPGQYIVFDAKDVLHSEEGTISLWVRPHWDWDTTSSHTFVSFKWLGSKPAYFALSHGWWEPNGAVDTYFVLNNQESALHRRIYHRRDRWMNLVCTWRAGDAGFVRLYVDGFLMSEQRKPKISPATPDGKFYIGSDLGTPMANGRWADSDIDEIAIFDRALPPEEVFALYHTVDEYSLSRRTDGIVRASRVIFDEGRGWMTKDGAERTISRIKKAGFNVYVPCVWAGEGTRYPSSVAVAEPRAGFSDDPLKRIIDLAHQAGLEVHAWFAVALRSRNFYTRFYEPGTPPRSFNLHNPDFRKFITDVIVDVVMRYDVDGINLDFIRTMGMCSSAYCQTDYRERFGRSLMDDIAYDSKHPNRDGTLEPHLQQWQDEAVAAVVRNVRDRVKVIRPGIILSIDGNPDTAWSFKQGRQEITWANSDLVDVVFSMDYGNRINFAQHNRVATKLRYPDKLHILAGNYVVDASEQPIRDRSGNVMAREATLVRDQVVQIQKIWSASVGIYDYRFLTDEQVKLLSVGPFRESARPLWPRRK